MDDKLVQQMAQEIKEVIQPIIEKHNLKLQFDDKAFDPNNGWYQPKFILRTRDIDEVDKAPFLLYVCMMKRAD